MNNEDSELIINQIPVWEQLKNSINTLGGDIKIYGMSNSRGDTGTQIKIYIPNKDN